MAALAAAIHAFLAEPHRHGHATTSAFICVISG
jgi:hypothetical protein